MVKNIVLITVDSLRRDRLLQFGSKRNVAPRINELAKSGISFSNAYTTGPGTSPSFRGILTGTYPLSYDGLGKLQKQRPMLSEEFQKNGFNTGGFQSNPFLTRHFNFDRGFDTFEDYQSSLMGPITSIFPRGKIHPKLSALDEYFDVSTKLKKIFKLFNDQSRPYTNATQIVDDFNIWLDNTENPFFGWVHLMDVHHPCYPPIEYRKQFDVSGITSSEMANIYEKMISNPSKLSDDEKAILIKLYDAAIRYVDDEIDRIIDILRSKNIFQETIVIITSDHGELHGEECHWGKPVVMRDELINVPLIINNSQINTEWFSNRLISLIDLPILIHDMLGIPINDKYEGQNVYKNPRKHILAEHTKSKDGDIRIGARSLESWVEFDSTTYTWTNRTGSASSGDGVYEGKISSENLKSIIKDRLKAIDDSDFSSLEDLQLDNETESRLEDLGYL
jgi:arylsulfatase A-like enzyme